MRVLGALTLVACGPLTAEEADQKLQDALVSTVERKDAVHNAVLRVDAPDLGVEGAWAAGIADERDGSAFTVDSPFLSASIGKLFTAAAVVALAEAGELDLDAPFVTYVEPAAVAGLPVEGGDEALATVTVRQLLSHRSGLPDYFDGSVSKTTDDSPSVLDLFRDEPDRAWTRDQLLAYTRDHYAPAGAPGAQFLYSDVNYDLLGMVLEAARGAPFEDVVTAEVIVPAGLTSTWYYNRSAPPDGVSAHADVWIDEVNVARAACLSGDGAGGGLATTTADLHRLLRSLNAGVPVALDALATDWEEDAIVNGIDYGYGAWRIRPGGISFLLGSQPDLIGVSGVTGSFLYYAAEWDAVISGSFDQTDYQARHVNFLLSRVIPTLQRVR